MPVNQPFRLTINLYTSMLVKQSTLPRDDDDNDGATEEQQSRCNLGKFNRDE